ncbi:hypothetical protein ACHABQ_13680 [Nesterenkonia aurantiaca]|uniref:hypothetical protein n=1 Tax=Nesterenkonia aurantiaca TaxID=1436010 RepID=UPI003EE4D5BD
MGWKLAKDIPHKLDRVFSRYVLAVAPFLVGEAFQQAMTINSDLWWAYACLALLLLVLGTMAWAILDDDEVQKSFGTRIAFAASAALLWGGLSFGINTVGPDGIGFAVLTLAALASVLIWSLVRRPAVARERQQKRDSVIAELRKCFDAHIRVCLDVETDEGCILAERGRAPVKTRAGHS